MAILKKNAFSRRVPDLVTEELVAVLSRRSSFEFKQLFDIVHENLRARNAASGGEEMLRLRAYEKLQNLVSRGMVKISVGKDDGLRKGHIMQVYRGDTYIGQIKIMEVGPDRAVGQLDKDLKRGQVRKGDHVTTKFS